MLDSKPSELKTLNLDGVPKSPGVPATLSTSELVARMNKPHYQKLKFNQLVGVDLCSVSKNLYDQHLQDGLLQYEVERQKMPVTVDGLCYNSQDCLYNAGGRICIGIGDGIDANIARIKNKELFAGLKSLSVYSKYLFDHIQGEDVLNIYDVLQQKASGIKDVTTYTIVYEVSDKMIREVTLHEFGSYGNILTVADLRLDRPKV